MKTLSQITPAKIKEMLSISAVLKYYGGECTSKSSGAWWCIMHEVGGKQSGHKTPSLVAKDERGTATCMSRQCFDRDDIFNVIAKMERLDIKNDFSAIKSIACNIAGINYSTKSLTKATNVKNSNIQKVIKELDSKHFKYLANIGISQETAIRFGLKARNEYILYPQSDDGITLGYKGISINKDKKTNKSNQFFEDYTASLFHELSPQEGKNIIFTEGEKDCLRLTEAILQAGMEDKFMAITITTGAKTVPQNILQKLRELKPSDIYIIYDNDDAGIEGGKKLASTLIQEFKKVLIYKFPKKTKSGYDVTDFLNEGHSLKDLFALDYEVLQKEEETLQSSYPRYVITKDSILDTLTPDRILYTGYKTVDEQCPIIQGENTIIVGRTGKGKTVLGVNFVNKILKNNLDAKIIVFSLELKKKTFLQRLFAAEYDIESWKIKNNFISKDNTVFTTQKKNYIESAEKYIELYKNRLLIIDDIHSIDQIEVVLDNLEINLNYKPDYILIDYANILSLKSLMDITKHIQISTWMKFLAKEKNIHVQAICQANRATKENDDGYARTENLADSDQYGRDAFVVYSIKTSMDSDVYSINPTKNRNGKPEEEIFLRWNPKSGSIISNERNTFIHRV
ncbi:bifunctional DNA primase/helicase [Candidatus Bandiella numerosa]|uniref:bifunctional DNA primase/helicase n=1 Tax=Candidatus Bandiella numerosa TaxID=2570586 RepID=UPI001F227597|nr:bifunctional DNA primase/helicase [Candidatus Bandiella numerosa]